MDKFSISDCKILWDKRARISKCHKAAIKADLKTMSNSIYEAMTYTKDKKLKEKRDTIVQFWLNTKTGDDIYTIGIHYDDGIEAWCFFIENVVYVPPKSVGQIVSEKWPSIKILQDVEEETL